MPWEGSERKPASQLHSWSSPSYSPFFVGWCIRVNSDHRRGDRPTRVGCSQGALRLNPPRAHRDWHAGTQKKLFGSGMRVLRVLRFRL